MFENRQEAGRKLAEKMKENIKESSEKLLVLAIPRGGVVVGKELANKLKAPLDIIITKKIGAPGNPELAIGAVGPGGEEVIDEELAQRTGADENYLKSQISNLKFEIARKEKEFRRGRQELNLENKIVIITDDGVATGATMLAAIEVLRQHQPKRIIVAVPVIARDTVSKLEAQADAVIYLEAPLMFFAVGQFYQNFPQVSDQEVIQLLASRD